MTDSDITIGIASTQAAVTALSAFTLSVQRAYLHKTKETSNLRFDTKRKFTDTHDPSILKRLSFDTLGLVALSVYEFYQTIYHPKSWHHQVSACVQLISWLYASVIVLVAGKHVLPSAWGWNLNVHLFLFYLTAWVISINNFYTAITSNDAPLHLASSLLFLILTSDLVYTSGTRPRGAYYLDENDKSVVGVEVASLFSVLYFNWATPLLNLAYKKQKLTDNDLPTLPALFRGYNLYYIFGATSGSLLKRIYHANRRSILIQIVLALFSSIFYYLPAYFMSQLLTLLQDMNGQEDADMIRRGFVFVAAMGVTVFISALVTGQLCYFASSDVQIKVKAMLNIEIYNKTLRRRDLSVDTKKDNTEEDTEEDTEENEEEDKEEEVGSSTGTVINLMSTDSDGIAEFATWWWSALQAPVELGVGIYFLYTLLGKSCFLGLLVMVIILPVNHYNAKMYASTQDKLMESRDKRVSLMNEMLQGIRQIKFFAWETNWEKRVMEARGVELYHLAITYMSNVLFTLTWQGAPVLVTLLSFWSFTKLEGKELTAPIAFTSINVFNELRFALNMLPEVFTEWLQALVSLRRIQTYLDGEEIDRPTGLVDKIGLYNATVGWSKETYSDTNEQTGFRLKDLNIEFPKDQLSLVSGATGSGKSLLMLSFLGEAVILKGEICCPRQPVADKVSDDFKLLSSIDPQDWILPYAVAYVSQTAWLQNASIRDNILFGLPYVESRYNETLTACALSKDLEILEDGDQTEIGEKGITLSGGQKARVCLARAVYSRAQNVLMDDVLSAVDAHTAKHLYEKCLEGPLMKNRTRILITHHVRLCAKGAAFIVNLDNNVTGTPEELRELGYLETEKESIEEDAGEENAIEETVSTKEEKQKKPRVLVEEESRATGRVKIELYKFYITLVGNYFFWLIMIILIFGSQVLGVAESWWIKKWSESYEAVSNDGAVVQSYISQSNPVDVYNHQPMLETEENKKNSNDKSINFYLGIYCLIAMGNIFVGILRYAILYWNVLGANKKLYQQLLQRVFRAPLRFFDTTPVGRILNRFSDDFETIDSSVPGHILQFIIQWILVASAICTVSSVLPIFLFPIFLVTLVNVYMGSMFVSASREFQRIESVSRSPLFSHFTETIVGVTTIRAFGTTRQFLQQMLQYMDANSRPSYYTWMVNRWVSMRYASSGALINILTGAIILYKVESMNASMAGFCLSFVLLFTDQMSLGIEAYTELEVSFNAVERVFEFLEIDQEAPAFTEVRPPANWPTKGGIVVNNLEVRYVADLDPVLKNLNFSVNPQEKIGVVGRTGSGKSTLALSFFRFIEVSQGSIVIDGIDIKDLGTEDLRSSLTIIPQDPTLFSGSLRFNMDPFDQFKDRDIFTALRRVHLLDEESQPDNTNVFKDLTTAVTEGGKNFSQGQRQLLCLARALLKRSRVVLMDEATASVDFETDRAIQKTISTEFADSTILCIAHRLHTVIEYDRILVLDKGNIVEFDSPLKLIKDTESVFHKMCRNSGEFDSLINLVKSNQLVDM